MNIEHSCLTEGYIDNQEDGVRGYGGKLDIRHPYQREFVYNDKQKMPVIDTVTKGFSTQYDVLGYARRWEL